MKKLYYLIVLALILGLILTGCLLSNVGQVPTTEQSGITYLTKGSSSGLVGLWHFDEGSNESKVSDSSGNGNEGNVNEATTGVSGKFGNALSFDGIDNYIDCGNDSSLDLSTLTIEAWIKPDVIKATYILSKAGTGTNKNYYIYLYPDGNIEGGVFDTLGADRASPTTSAGEITAGSWYHIAYTYDGSVGKFYIDGALKVTESWSGTVGTATTPFYIGQRLGGYFFDGTIDEVRIWNTATPSFNLNIEPKLDFNPVGTDHTVTATVTIDKVVGGTEPAPGVLVDFTVSGVNPETDSVYTDSNGQATFTYTGDGDAGIDTITASLNYPFYQTTPDSQDSVDKYWLENYVTGGGKINMSTLGLNGGKKAAFTFGGTVGNLEDGSVGQFQIVDHTDIFREGKGAVSWHCNNFTYLEFSGEPAESPEATHNTAIFEGEFTSNRGDTETLQFRLIDNGEPGARVDTFSIWFFGNWLGGTIDGGNLQVHDIED